MDIQIRVRNVIVVGTLEAIANALCDRTGSRFTVDTLDIDAWGPLERGECEEKGVYDLPRSSTSWIQRVTIEGMIHFSCSRRCSSSTPKSPAR